MSWTLTLSLILPAIVFVAFMHQAIQKIKRSAFVYPSEAIIDQTLPPEILEEVLMNLDFQTLLACTSVSKYWCYHSNKKQIRDVVFSKIGQSRAAVEELKSDLKDRYFDLTTIKWLDYPKDYSPQWHIQDKLLAERVKKSIIDADSASLVPLKVALGAPAYGPYNNAGNATKYLAKMRLEASHQNDKDWLFRNEGSNYFTVPKDAVPPHWHFSVGSTVEIIADLPYVQQHYSQFPRFYGYRIMDNLPKLAGLISLNTNILYILFFWYAPCVIVDYWASTNPNKYWADLLLCLIGAAGQAFIGSIVLWDSNSDATFKKRAAAIFIPAIILVIGLFFIFSTSAREVFYMTSLVAGCFIYVGLAHDYYRKDGFEFRMFVLFTAYCMVLLMNDWRLTVDAFKSGEIWFTFLRNFSLYAALLVFAILINFIRLCIQNFKLDLKALITWEKNTVEFLALNAIAVVFITLHGPLTTRFMKESY